MRLFFCLFALALFVPALPAAEEADQAARLEKAGARVTVDADLPADARLRVVFSRLDDKGAVALRGATHVGALSVEDATRLTDRSLAIVGALPHLRELALFRAGISNAGAGSLKGLKELRKLYLTDAKLYDSGVAALKGLDQLEELDLSGTAITSGAAATFKTLTSLKLLAVSKTRFGDAGAAQLHDLTHLRQFEAINTDLSVKAAMALEAAVPGVRVRR